ncbi:c-type cytochrome [Pedobacter hartonius]|uniref:Cytochrome c n=1 Tax=Pedobacter hartonius TaxID=425514 RepID=A0A1H4BJ44_9SPHI|nr:c-type cytochrome [Pedobacter hartonius]SEA48140.1 cytochrome c [Pedobacter hartonius]
MKLKFIFSCCLFIAVLGSNDAVFSQTKKTAKTVTKVTTTTRSAAGKKDIEAGKMLISKSDCMGCHSLENKMVGPAYITIAQTYPMTDANVTALSQKIINGGSGKWGQIPMTPHPGITSPDAKKIVKYILSLKK